MKKSLIVSLSVFLVIFIFSAVSFAVEYDLDIAVACPASVKQGTALTVTVTAYNWDCVNNASLTRGMVVFGGNSGGTIGGVGIWGPYNKNWASNPWNIGHATGTYCDTPGQVTRSFQVIGAVPASLAGTVAMVSFEFLDSAGHTIEGNTCMVSVTN
jgi:hypothetical protein